ncbi:MAG: family N-acetyltransferase [Nocardioidaceae bacterium]|nr:family N-acetyltransferase [Nocardioidaceae bacterium]
MEVREVTAAESADLRRRVLRGGRDVPLPGDEEPSHHVGVYDEGRLVATGNIRKEPSFHLSETWWRIRGMATEPDHRGRGAGRLVLDALLEHARTNGGGGVWCNARLPAVAFYERAGFVTDGAEWTDPEIGPHVRMWVGL